MAIVDRRIPVDLRDALVTRDEAQRALRVVTRDLQDVLARYAGQAFEVEGVPVKVCGKVGDLYLRRMVSAAEAEALREKWRLT